MNYNVAQEILAAHIRDDIPGAPLNLDIEIDAFSPVQLPFISDATILGRIAAGKREDKIELIKELRQFAADQGVTFGLAFAKRLVELAPQFKD